MKAWDFNEWHQTLTRTQSYVRSRIRGDRCARDLVDAWRLFYQTHEPLVKVLVSRQGLSGALADRCAETIWVAILVGLPKLHPPVTYDAFLHWLNQLVRTKAHDARGQAANGTAASLEPVTCTADTSQSGPAIPESSPLNERLFELRVVEERPVADVAQAVGLSPAQVALREDDMLRKILTILIKLDA